VLFFDADLQVKSWQLSRRICADEMTDDELHHSLHGRPNAYVLSFLAAERLRGKTLDLIQSMSRFYRKLGCLSNPSRLMRSPARGVSSRALRAATSRAIATIFEIRI